jgi:hypothetical protein
LLLRHGVKQLCAANRIDFTHQPPK